MSEPALNQLKTYILIDDSSLSRISESPAHDSNDIKTHLHPVLPYGYRVQWVLDYQNPDFLYLSTWTSAHVAMFSAPAGKWRCGQWNFATGESKAAVWTTFLNVTMLFPSSTGFPSQFTTSGLAEQSHKHTVLQSGKLTIWVPRATKFTRQNYSLSANTLTLVSTFLALSFPLCYGLKLCCLL